LSGKKIKFQSHKKQQKFQVKPKPIQKLPLIKNKRFKKQKLVSNKTPASKYYLKFKERSNIPNQIRVNVKILFKRIIHYRRGQITAKRHGLDLEYQNHKNLLSTKRKRKYPI
jgi:hypothetical protein